MASQSSDSFRFGFGMQELQRMDHAVTGSNSLRDSLQITPLPGEEASWGTKQVRPGLKVHAGRAYIAAFHSGRR